MQEATIVERLRGLGRTEDDQMLIVSTKGNHTSILSKIDHEAASLIECQQQVIDLLMKAVEPFAEYHAWAKKWEWPEAIAADDGTPILGRESYDSDNPPNFTVTVGSFRRAREAKVEAEKLLNSTPSTEDES